LYHPNEFEGHWLYHWVELGVTDLFLQAPREGITRMGKGREHGQVCAQGLGFLKRGQRGNRNHPPLYRTDAEERKRCFMDHCTTGRQGFLVFCISGHLFTRKCEWESFSRRNGAQDVQHAASSASCNHCYWHCWRCIWISIDVQLRRYLTTQADRGAGTP
jgi:hypothetical protein